MVKIRLRRMGTTKKPTYRLVVADSRTARDGAFICIIGHYDPRTEPETVVIKEEEALKWLSQGAQPTATAARLLTKVGVMDKFKAVKEKA
jgi:small subunit ribosomal protein S16